MKKMLIPVALVLLISPGTWPETQKPKHYVNLSFTFVHKRPSTVNYVFCGTDDLTYLIELTYTIGNHPIGLLSPGILKNRPLNLSFFF